MTKRLIDGDVVEFAIDGQFGYVQRLGRHTRYGDAIVVYPRLLTVQVSAEQLERCFMDQACFVVFFPLQLAVKERLGEIVASLPCRPMPKSLRRPRTIKPMALLLRGLLIERTGKLPLSINYRVLTKSWRSV